MRGTLFCLRSIFVITISSICYQISMAVFGYPPFSFVNIMSIILGALLAVGIIWVEIQYANHFVVAVFTVVLGLLIGFVASHLFIQAISLVPHIRILKEYFGAAKIKRIEDAMNVGINFFFCYLAIAILLRTQNRFKLLIPFVELTNETKESHFILDSSVIIDGRLISLYETNVLRGKFVVPRFILNELHILADSSDKKKRMRGHRGIDMLGELQKKPGINIYFDSELFPKIREVDGKLVALAQKMRGILVTNDYNLKKIAELQQVEVVNLNSLANALRPPVLPGEVISIEIIKAGESQDQGIGYLNDGTVVIVENGIRNIGKEMEIVVTNVLQTNMGRMVFGKPNH